MSQMYYSRYLVILKINITPYVQIRTLQMYLLIYALFCCTIYFTSCAHMSCAWLLLPTWLADVSWSQRQSATEYREMAALCPGVQYGLSSQGNFGENKDLIFVKLTDSAYRAIEDYFKNQVSCFLCLFWALWSI